MAPHSSTLAWKIPWMEDPGRLQSMELLRVGHDWATSLSCIGERNDNPLQCSCLENPRDGGAYAVYGVTQSRTRLKRLSSSSSSMATPTQWTRAWASSGRGWRTRKPGVLQSMGSQRVGHNWATEQQQQDVISGLTGGSALYALLPSVATGHMRRSSTWHVA